MQMRIRSLIPVVVWVSGHHTNSSSSTFAADTTSSSHTNILVLTPGFQRCMHPAPILHRSAIPDKLLYHTTPSTTEPPGTPSRNLSDKVLLATLRVEVQLFATNVPLTLLSREIIANREKKEEITYKPDLAYSGHSGRWGFLQNPATIAHESTPWSSLPAKSAQKSCPISCRTPTSISVLYQTAPRPNFNRT